MKKNTKYYYSLSASSYTQGKLVRLEKQPSPDMLLVFLLLVYWIIYDIGDSVPGCENRVSSCYIQILPNSSVRFPQRTYWLNGHLPSIGLQLVFWCPGSYISKDWEYQLGFNNYLQHALCINSKYLDWSHKKQTYNNSPGMRIKASEEAHKSEKTQRKLSGSFQYV